MRIFTLLAMLTMGLHLVSAQAPFSGGEGDGYGRASLSIGTNVKEASAQAWRVYPQPARVGQAIELSYIADQPATWALLDLQGRSLRQGQFSSQQAARLETDELLPGRYFLRITTKQGTASRPITLQPR